MVYLNWFIGGTNGDGFTSLGIHISERYYRWWKIRTNSVEKSRSGIERQINENKSNSSLNFLGTRLTYFAKQRNGQLEHNMQHFGHCLFWEHLMWWMSEKIIIKIINNITDTSHQWYRYRASHLTPILFLEETVSLNNNDKNHILKYYWCRTRRLLLPIFDQIYASVQSHRHSGQAYLRQLYWRHQ